MLLEDFYSILKLEETEDSTLLASVIINKNHSIFNGHFPNHPVTPGAAMLQILKNCIETHFKSQLFMESISNVKFLALVNPTIQNEIHFSIHFQLENNHIKVKNHTSFADRTSVLKCNATFAKLA